MMTSNVATIARIRPHLNEHRLVAAALVEGVAISPGMNYHINDGESGHVRLSYVAAPSPADIHDAIGRLAPLLIES
jgi:DNA-binding transcriptional MocR family regulator